MSRTAGVIMVLGMAVATPFRTEAATESLASALPVLRQESPPDSSQLHDRARDAQRRFERERIRRLPFRFAGSGPCDERIGRFCMDHRSDGLWDFPPEDPRVQAARESFLTELHSISERIPGDAWVLGQRVFYLGEADRWEDAARLAERCEGGDRPWCDQLLGLALHSLGDFVRSEEVFERMLASLDRESAEEWRDPWILLDGKGRGTVDDLDGEALREAWRNVWTWADPYYSMPGNDRLTEHYSRRVVAQLRERVLTPYNLRWGDDLEEILIRYGWEVGWETTEPTVRFTRGGSTWGHHHPESRPYVPPGEVLERREPAEEGDWIGERETPRSGYAPLYAPEMVAVRPPVSVLRYGDSIRVVAPQPTSDTLGTGRYSGGMYLVPGGAARFESGGWEDGGASIVAPPGVHLLSVEVVDLDAGIALRHRRWLEEGTYPPGVPLLSDLIPLERSPGLPPDSLSEAMSELRSTLRYPPGDTLRFGWVLHSVLPQPGPVRFRLKLLDPGGGLFDWLGDRLGIGGDDPSLLLEWSEPWPEGTDSFFRAVDLALPPIELGEYLLRLEVELPGRSTMAAERQLQIARSPG